MTDFINGESDPKDFSVDQVAAHLEGADADERARVLGLEGADDGKQRKGILEAPEPASPTAPTLATESSLNDDQLQGETEPEPEAEGPQVGDERPHDPTEAGAVPEGYTEVVVSTDGSPTELAEEHAANAAEEPVVRK